MPIALTTPIAIGTIDRVRCNGYSIRGLYDTANATITVHLQRVLATGGIHQDLNLDVQNGQPLRDLMGVEVKPSSNWATQLAQTILAAIGNPRTVIEQWLVTNQVVQGTA